MYLRECANLFAKFTDTKTLARLIIYIVLLYIFDYYSQLCLTKAEANVLPKGVLENWQSVERPADFCCG
jgi:hypothetical protein